MAFTKQPTSTPKISRYKELPREFPAAPQEILDRFPTASEWRARVEQWWFETRTILQVDPTPGAVATTQEDLTVFKAETLASIGALQTTVAALEAEDDELAENLAATNTTLTALSGDVTTNTVTITSIQTTITSINSTTSSLQQQINNIGTTLGSGADYNFPYWFSNSLTTTGPIETDVSGDIHISPGGGIVAIYPAAGPSEFRLLDTSGGEWVGFKANATVTGTVVWELPAADGANSFVLQTNGAGILSWIANGAGVVTGITSLNGLTVAAQTFTNDTNVTIVSPNPGGVGAAHVITWSGTIGVARGGTNIASYTAGDLIYASAGATLSKLAAGTSSQVLHSGTTPSWGAVALATETSGILKLVNGGTEADLSAAAKGMLVLPGSGGAITRIAGTNYEFPYWLNNYLLTSGSTITGDSSGNIFFTPTGGVITIGKPSSGTTELRFTQSAAGTNYVGFKSAASVTTQNYTLPTALPGEDRILQTSSTGTLTWILAAAGVVTSITGTALQITIGGTAAVPVISIATGYLGQASITTLGTITSGIWTGSSISTTYTDAKIASVTGTADKISISGPASAPVFTISGTYAGQASINVVGTIGSGIWNGNLIGATYGGTGSSAAFTSGGIAYASSPSVLATGSDLTYSGGVLSLAPSGLVINTGNLTELRFLDTAGGQYVGFVAPGVVSTSGTYTWPAAIPGENRLLQSSSAGALTWVLATGGTVTSVSGTTNQIDVATGTTTPVISISASYAGQASIVTLGTVTTGIWSANTITVAKGGTNVTSLTAGGILYASSSSQVATSARLTWDDTNGILALTAGAATSGIKWLDLNGSNYVFIQAPSDITQSQEYKLPEAYPTTGGYALVSTTGGVMSWAPVGAGTVTGTGVANALAYWSTGTSIANLGLGTTVTVLHGNASGLATWGAVALATDVSGVLPAANGGVGTGTDGYFPQWSSNTLTSTSPIRVTSNLVRITPAGNIVQLYPTTSPNVTCNLRFYDLAGTSFVGFVALNSGVTSGTYTLPPAIPAGNRILQSDSSGFLTWVADSTGAGTVTSVTGVAGKISVTNPTTTPLVTIDANYTGQTSISDLGTIVTGQWNAGYVESSGLIVAHGTGTAADGGGLEMHYAAGSGFLLSVDRTGGDTAMPLTISGAPISLVGTINLPGLTASRLLMLDGSKNIVSITAAETNLYVLTTNGSGTYTWTAAGGGPGTGTDGYFPQWSSNTLTGTSPIYTASGKLNILATSGLVQLLPPSGTATAALRFFEGSDNGSNFTALRAAASLSGDLTYVLPSTNPTAGQILSSTAPSGGVATLSWIAAGAGVVTSITGTTNKIDVDSSNPAVPIITVSTNYVGQVSISTLGTIATGQWRGTIVEVEWGGTGFGAYTVGDILYANSATTLAKLAYGAAGRVLASNGDGTYTWTSPTGGSFSGTAGRFPFTGADTLLNATDSPILYSLASGVIGFFPDNNAIEIREGGDATRTTMEFFENSGSGTNWTGIRGPASTGSNFTMSLPAGAPGADNTPVLIDIDGTIHY